MPQKYYNVAEAAKILGLSEGDIKQMLESNELHGYRDGADWKFKSEDIEKLAGSGLNLLGEDGEDLLMVDPDAAGSPDTKEGAVIGGGGQEDDPLADSYVQLGESALQSDAPDTGPDAGPQKDKVDTAVSQFEELDLTLDEDLTLEDSTGGVTDEQSTIDLSGSDLDDDDLVLGGSSGGGSDISIGGDSGISLVDPIDSGLSLEEPLSLSSTSGDSLESLELGEDDMISLGTSDAGEDAPTELKTDDDFLLTPLEDAGDEDSESGSQVIALDTDGDEGATMIADEEAGGVAAMLDEDLSDQPAGMGMGIAGLEQPAGFVEGAPLTQPEAVLPEMPYSIWNVLSLALCVIFLALSGMFMYDLLRNMWSWDAPYEVNSSMMDNVLSWFEGEQ